MLLHSTPAVSMLKQLAGAHSVLACSENLPVAFQHTDDFLARHRAELLLHRIIGRLTRKVEDSILSPVADRCKIICIRGRHLCTGRHKHEWGLQQDSLSHRRTVAYKHGRCRTSVAYPPKYT